MSSRIVRIKWGYDKEGNPVYVPLFHTGAFGQSGTGKSTSLRKMIKGAVDAGWRVLAIDVKKERDFEGLGTDVLPFLSGSTDPLLIKRVVESSVTDFSVYGAFTAIMRACDGAETLQEVYQNAVKLSTDEKEGSVKADNYEKLAYYLSKLVERVEKVKFAKKFHLPSKINVMDLSLVPTDIQHLVVDSVLNHALDHEKKLVILLEEAIRFVPREEKSEAETTVRKFVREGRAAGLYLWLSSQSITALDPDTRKQIQTWICGRQMDINEAERVVKQIPVPNVKAEQIQRLPKGWFYVVGVEEDEVKTWHAYAQPEWLDDKNARLVAMGKKPVSEFSIMRREKAKEVTDKFDRELEKLKGKLDLPDESPVDSEIEALRRHTGRVHLTGESGSTAHSRMDPQVPTGAPSGFPPAPAVQPARETSAVPEQGKGPASVLGVAGSSPAATFPSPFAPGPVPTDFRGRILPTPGLTDPQGKLIQTIEQADQSHIQVERDEPAILVRVRKTFVRKTDDEPQGRYAILIAEGFFDGFKTWRETVIEAKSRGWGDWSGSASKRAGMEILRWFAERRFLTVGAKSGGTAAWRVTPTARSRIYTEEEVVRE
jgi:hypothetical protein